MKTFISLTKCHFLNKKKHKHDKFFYRKVVKLNELNLNKTFINLLNLEVPKYQISNSLCE